MPFQGPRNYEFLRAVAGETTFDADFANALAVQRVLDAVERSDEAGEWVTPEGRPTG